MEREAKAISSLNHRHICHLYDIGSQDGTDYMVMEFLEGETLAERLRKGAMPLNEIFKTGIAVAEALAVAHRQGWGTRVLREITTLAGVALGDHELFSFSMPSRHSSLRGRYSLPILPELPITETIDEVIVYHSNSLHVGIHDCRTNETESAMLEVLAECIGFG